MSGDLHVAVVESLPLMRHGLVDALDRDPRLHVSVDEADPVALDRHGAAFDVCVLDLDAVASAEQLRALTRRGPVVVHTASRRWDQWVGVWLCGARGVVNRHLGRVPMADVVVDAAHDPLWIGRQLAVALGRAVTDVALDVDARTPQLLALLAGGRRSGVVREQLGLDVGGHETLLAELRAACGRSRLGGVDPCGPPPGPDPFFSPEPRPSDDPPEVLLLTDRELDVVRLLAAGCTREEIAAELFLAPVTVRNHVANVMNRLGVRCNNAENRLWVALHLTGGHRDPEAARRRFRELVAGR